MAVIELMVTGTATTLRATEDFNCDCCNVDGNSDENGVVKKGELFVYLNVYSQFVLKYNGEFIIPYAHQTDRTLHMNPKKFKRYVKMHRVCPKCFNKLALFLRLSGSGLPPINVIFPIKTDRIYYTKVSVSEKDYICTCCGKTIPTGSEYVRFGIFQTGCTCMKCFDVFKHLE